MSFRYSPKIVTDGLILYYDGINPQCYVSGSTTSNDLSITQSTGTLKNGVTYDTDNNGSWVFDGLDDYIEISDNEIFELERTDSFSLSGWINVNSYSLTTTEHILSKYSNPPARGYYFAIINGKISFSLQSFGGGDGLGVNTVNTINLQQWYYITTTYDGSSSASGVNIYINGVNEATSIAFNTLTGSILNPTSLKIGGLVTPSRYFDGKISVAKIYNRELSPTEIKENYNTMKSRFNL
jgi:hypothetical protein